MYKIPPGHGHGPRATARICLPQGLLNTPTARPSPQGFTSGFGNRDQPWYAVLPMELGQLCEGVQMRGGESDFKEFSCCRGSAPALLQKDMLGRLHGQTARHRLYRKGAGR